MAVERHIARSHSEAQVDLLDLFVLTAAPSPHWRRRDVLTERLNRKVARFVRPLVNGREITGDIRLMSGAIPHLPDDLRQLRGYRTGSARTGLAVLSSVTSLTTVQEPGSRSEYGGALPRAWLSAHLAAQTGEAVRRFGYDEIYTFNGRACYSRPFCDLLDQDSRVFRYEQGGSGNTFVMADRSIHCPKVTAELVRASQFDAATGEAFYRDRLRKAAGDPVNFYTSGQVDGLLPENVAAGDFIAFFTSSSDEFAAVSDDVNFGEFANQFEAAMAMAEVARTAGRRLVLRLHPHLRYKHPSWVREWDFERLRQLGTMVVRPEDPYDSYALAAAAHCVFTCGSTVGLECSFRGIPNADVGRWVGSYIGAMYAVTNPWEIAQFVARPILPPTAREGALRYGSYTRLAGTSLPELDVGSHPYYARIDGRIVDPVRCALQRARDAVRRSSVRETGGMVGGKIVMDPTIEARLRAIADGGASAQTHREAAG